MLVLLLADVPRAPSRGSASKPLRGSKPPAGPGGHHRGRSSAARRARPAWRSTRSMSRSAASRCSSACWSKRLYRATTRPYPPGSGTTCIASGLLPPRARDRYLCGCASPDPAAACTDRRRAAGRNVGPPRPRRSLEGDRRATRGEHAALRELDRDAVAGVIWSMNAPEFYTLLVDERGWSPDRFAAWIAEAWERLLLAD